MGSPEPEGTSVPRATGETRVGGDRGVRWERGESPDQLGTRDSPVPQVQMEPPVHRDPLVPQELKVGSGMKNTLIIAQFVLLKTMCIYVQGHRDRTEPLG